MKEKASHESVDSLDRGMGTMRGMLNSNKKECQKEHLNFPLETNLQSEASPEDQDLHLDLGKMFIKLET